METNPAGNETRPAELPKRTWKDYIGWAGFIVTAGILIQQIYIHADGFWYFCFGEGRQYLGALGDPQYSLLYHITTVFDFLTDTFFTLYPLLILVLLLLRKKIVPKLLVVFAAVALFTNIATDILYSLLAAEYEVAYYIDFTSVVYLAIDIALVLFYAKSKRFKDLFVK